MAPPPKGTAAYDAYLEDQKMRRRRVRTKLQKDKRRKAAQPFVRRALSQSSEQVRCLTQTVDSLRQRSNGHLRARQKAEAKAKAAEEAARELRNELLEEREKTSAAEQKAAQRLGALNSWEAWWGRLTSRAPPSLLARVRSFARRPRPPPQWTWWEQ